jgi:hypothetical protein
LSSDTLINSINDIFVLSTSGIPLYASCFGGDICSKRPDHLLQSGFIVAMFSFAKEFGQKSIIFVEFENGRMVFASRTIESFEFLVVFFTTNKPSIEEVKNLVTKSADLFLNNYGQKALLSNHLINTKDYADFTKDLLTSGIMNRNPMGDIAPLIKSKKKKKFFLF